MEEEVPKIAESATAAAHKRALAVGSVLIVRQGKLVKLEAGGKKSTVVKDTEPRVRIPKGTRFILKPA